MPKVYLWKNVKTGELVEHDHYSEPPKKKGKWVREYSFGISSVSGVGGSPSRSYHTRA